MQSSGGVVDLAAAARAAVRLRALRAGGGVVAAAFVAAESGYGDLLTFDMGGTGPMSRSCSVARFRRRRAPSSAGVPIEHPLVDVHTVSAGGGSIASVDPGGALRVGPRSAGRRPGPRATAWRRPSHGYRRQPLPRLPPDGATSAGRSSCDASPRRARDRALASNSGSTRSRPPPAWSRSPRPEMVPRAAGGQRRAGVDPRELTLVAFGGAGGCTPAASRRSLGSARASCRERRAS